MRTDRLSLEPVAQMLLCAGNRSEPALASRRPQFITRREVRWRFVQGADSNLDFVGAVYAPKHGGSARRAKVTVVGRKPPASSFAGYRYFARLARPQRSCRASPFPFDTLGSGKGRTRCGSPATSNLIWPQLHPPVRFRMSRLDSGSMSLRCSEPFLQQHARWGPFVPATRVRRCPGGARQQLRACEWCRSRERLSLREGLEREP